MTGKEAPRPAHVELRIQCSFCERNCPAALPAEGTDSRCFANGAWDMDVRYPVAPSCLAKARVRPQRNKARDVFCINAYKMSFKLFASTVSENVF